jgi:hypothetical protein
MADNVLSATDLLGNAGPKPTITWRGKVYTASLCCPAVVSLMEREVLKDLVASIKDLQKLAEDVPELADELNPQIALLQSHIGGRKWSYMQTYYQQAMGKTQFQPLQLWAMVADNHKEFTLGEAMELVSEEPEQVMTVMGVADPGFFELLAKTSAISKENARKTMIQVQEARAKACQALKTHFQSGSVVTQGFSETPSVSALPT